MRDIITVEEWIARGEDASTYWCRNRKTPFVLAGMFTGILKTLMSDKDALYPGVPAYVPGGNCPGSLYIEGSNVWKDNVTDPRPAVIVDIGDLQVQQDAYHGIDQRARFDLEEGEAVFEPKIVGVLVFMSLGKNKGQAQMIASNVYDLIDGFSNAIRTDFCFDKFDITAILRPRLRRTEPEDWECLVQATFTFREGYSLKHESPKLKEISLKSIIDTNISS